MNSQPLSLPAEILAAFNAATRSSEQPTASESPHPTGAFGLVMADHGAGIRFAEQHGQTLDALRKVADASEKSILNQSIARHLASPIADSDRLPAAASGAHPAPVQVLDPAPGAAYQVTPAAAAAGPARPPPDIPPAVTLSNPDPTLPAFERAAGGASLPPDGKHLPHPAQPSNLDAGSRHAGDVATKPAAAQSRVVAEAGGMAAAHHKSGSLETVDSRVPQMSLTGSRAPGNPSTRGSETAAFAAEATQRQSARPDGVVDRAVQIEQLMRPVQPGVITKALGTALPAAAESKPAVRHFDLVADPATTERVRTFSRPDSVLSRNELGLNWLKPVGAAGTGGPSERPTNSIHTLQAQINSAGTDPDTGLPGRGQPVSSQHAFAASLENDSNDLRLRVSEPRRADTLAQISATISGADLSPRPSAPASISVSHAASTDFSALQSVVSEQVGTRLISMTMSGHSVAKLQLQPAELGALEIRIAMQDDGAVVSINAQQPHARELIEAGLPRLREMFEAAGTGLLDVDISGNGGGAADDGAATRHVMEASSEMTQTAAHADTPTAESDSGLKSARLLDLYV